MKRAREEYATVLQQEADLREKEFRKSDYAKYMEEQAMIMLQLNPPINVMTDLGPGNAELAVDYGPDADAYYCVVLDHGPRVWLKTSECRRATNLSAGYDPDGRARAAMEKACQED